ncbi:MAG: hypothetical protein H0X62_07940, partial [Bacteroidetes bacterium]|nr:hypothetical protein [Bacteroidota bacterium]
ITAVVSIFIIIILITCLFFSNVFSALNFTILIGALATLLGFLFYNWNPSKIYMGDTGSQFIGCFLAIYSIPYFWNFTPVGQEPMISQQIIIVGLAFLIPIADTTTVTINRLLKGQSPFVGGKDHTTHHLSYLGLSDKWVARVFILISVVSLFFVYVIINFISNWSYLYFSIFAFYILIIASGLYTVTRINHKQIRQ